MTMLTSTYPLARSDTQQLSATADARPWGFWATLGWFGVAVATYLAVSGLYGLGYALWSTIAHPGVAIDLESAVLEQLGGVIPMPVAALVMMLAARYAGPSVRGYIGLTLPRGRHILIGLGAAAALWGLTELVFWLLPAYDPTPQLIREYRALLGNPTALALFWLGAVVCAPVAEEIVFRGFLMRGWFVTRLGVIGTILLSSAAFAVVHLQYNLPTMFAVFCLGVLLAVARWRTGSTILAIMMHAAWNLTTVLQVAWSA